MENLSLEQEVEIEDRLEKLAEILLKTTPAEIDALIEKHKAEIASLLRVKRLLGAKTAATPRGGRIESIKEVFLKNGNRPMLSSEIAAEIGCKPQSVGCALMRGKRDGTFEQKGKAFRLKDFEEE